LLSIYSGVDRRSDSDGDIPYSLPKMSDECPRYIFRQDTQLCGG